MDGWTDGWMVVGSEAAEPWVSVGSFGHSIADDSITTIFKLWPGEVQDARIARMSLTITTSQYLSIIHAPRDFQTARLFAPSLARWCTTIQCSIAVHGTLLCAQHVRS